MTDIDQGAVGDCYFMAALASIAKLKPSFIKHNIVDLDDGTYAVHFKTFFGFGDEYIRVDGDLPLAESGGLLYAGTGAEGSIWAAIAEKAWTFQRRNEGTYESISNGPAVEVFNALGLANERFDVGSSKTALMDRLKSELAAGRAVTGGTIKKAKDGIVGKHAYVVERLITNSAGAVTDVVLYNPWGNSITFSANQVFNNFHGFTSAKLS